MSIAMKEKEMRALAAELAKKTKTEKDLNDFSKQLKKMTVEAVLGVAVKRSKATTVKWVLRCRGIVTARLNRCWFAKGQTRLAEFDAQIYSLYARGMTTCGIVDTFKEMYGADVSATLISSPNAFWRKFTKVVSPPR